MIGWFNKFNNGIDYTTINVIRILDKLKESKGTIIYAYVSKVIKQNGTLVSEIRAMQKVFSIFKSICVTRINRINNIQKSVSKFMFT